MILIDEQIADNTQREIIFTGLDLVSSLVLTCNHLNPDRFTYLRMALSIDGENYMQSERISSYLQAGYDSSLMLEILNEGGIGFYRYNQNALNNGVGIWPVDESRMDFKLPNNVSAVKIHWNNNRLFASGTEFKIFNAG